MSELVAVFETEHSSAKEAIAALGKLELPDGGDAREELREVLKKQFDVLDQGPPFELSRQAQSKWLKDRGYKLEVIVFKLLALEHLKPGTSYYADAAIPSPAMLVDDETIDEDEEHRISVREAAEESVESTISHGEVEPRGRKSGGAQIDGFFELDRRFFLVETKWTTKPIPASELFAFRGKVDGKLVGTLGVVISAGDFAENAWITLMMGRAFNVILVNKDDLAHALSRGRSFSEMRYVKLRAAAQAGVAWYSYSSHLDRQDRGGKKKESKRW